MLDIREAEILPVADSPSTWCLICPVCDFGWIETTHSLWNVGALTCDQCGEMLAIPDEHFHGDANASHDT